MRSSPVSALSWSNEPLAFLGPAHFDHLCPSPMMRVSSGPQSARREHSSRYRPAIPVRPAACRFRHCRPGSPVRSRTVGANFLEPFDLHFVIGTNATTIALVLESSQASGPATRVVKLPIEVIYENVQPRPSRCLAALGSDLTGAHFQLAFPAPLPVNATLRHKRDSKLAACEPPQPAPDLIRLLPGLGFP
jgi:hypothetical protein